MSHNVVFVDDSKSILKTVEILLKNKIKDGEINLITFNKSLDFIDRLNKKSIEFDILFLDINMPGFSGYDIIKHMNNITYYKNKPIIALTTEASRESQELGKNAGFSDWIVKINAPSTLLKSILSMFDRYLIKAEEAPTKVVLSSNQDAINEMGRLFEIIEDLNKKLVIAEENKSRFLSLIHNEFNNPLLSVTMLMKDIIDDKTKTKEDIVDSIDMIFTDILVLNNQLSNILAAADIESTTGMEKVATYFSLKDVIIDILDNLSMIYKDKAIKIDSKIDLPEIVFNDRDKIFLIIRNLIENAFEFSPDVTNILMEGYVEAKNIVFTVQNEGNEIKEQKRMYDAFYQEKSDFARIHHGLGLGLAIVKHYCNFLGGLVMYSFDGKYNIFKVSFPLEVDLDTVDNQEICSFSFSDNENPTSQKF
jgi:signal transduction histidine kinase